MSSGGVQLKEFNPACERHYPLLIIKAVEPGCTTEFQIENAQTGEITRVTTTDDSEMDETAYLEAVVNAAKMAWWQYSKSEHATGTVATT